MFYSLFIPCLFFVNIFDSHSFIITSFKINDNFKSSIFLFCFFLAKTKLPCHNPGFVINHALYVFFFLSPFNRCINCTCRQNISREIYFCTNPTHRRLSKMVGRSVENEIKIRADIKTRALLSRGSTDIYADICSVYVSIT